MIQTVSLKLVTTGLNKILSDMLQNTTGAAYKGLLGQTYLGLFTTPFAGFSNGLTGAGITEPTYAGYARVLATWSVKGIDPSGRPEVFSQSVLWNPTSGAGSSTIIGCALWDSLAAGNLFGVGLLASPFTLATVNDMASLVARFQLPLDNADWGQSAFTS